MDARLRRLARWRLAAIPVALALVLLVAWGAWSAWKRRPDPETRRQRAEAMALITQDDAASLARAVVLLDAILAGDHPSTAAAGERGLARALLATALAEEAEPLGERLASGIAEKARLERERPPGYEDGQRALAMEVTRLEAELAPRRQKLREVEARAADDLQAVAASSAGGAEAARGQAVLAVLAGDAEEVRRAAALLRGAGPDPWADLVELWLAVRRDGAARDQAIPRLVALTGARPEMIRARFVLARALLSAGRREEAISAVAGLLAANPRHERAQRLRAQLTAASPPQPPEPPPPAPRPAWTPRPVASPPPAVAGNVLGTVPIPPPALPPQAAVNQAAIPATPPPGPTVEVPVPAAPFAPPPPPPPPPAPKAKPPEQGRAFDPTDG